MRSCDSDYVSREREIERQRGSEWDLLLAPTIPPQGNVRINLLRDYPSYTMFSVLPIVCLFKHN